MAKFFEVGKMYGAADGSFDPIIILKRTDKTIVVHSPTGSSWRMKIRTDDEGNEFAYDSYVPVRWRSCVYYSSVWECDPETWDPIGKEVRT